MQLLICVESISKIKKVAFLSSFPPRHCGIATFTIDLINGLCQIQPQLNPLCISVTDKCGAYNYDNMVHYEIHENDFNGFFRASDFVKLNEVDIICVQHEFGIYGKNHGNNIFAFLENVEAPVITTLHTVIDNPSDNYLLHFEQLSLFSTRFVVMTKTGADILENTYSISPKCIDVIPHGIPDVHLEEQAIYKSRLNLTERFVLLTYGLLSPDKGIEFVIKALPEIKKVIPEIVYIICGETHPKVFENQGNLYRHSLEELISNLKLESNVILHNDYVSPEKLIDYIGAADICIVPHLNEKQISSGTLSYCFGAGKAVIATPFLHATSLLKSNSGIIVPFRNSSAISDSVINLYKDPLFKQRIQQEAYNAGREMIWSKVANDYLCSFEKARFSFPDHVQLGRRYRNDSDFYTLPVLRFDHLIRMTDSNGLLQHGKCSFPNYAEGYCTDDNARALNLCALTTELHLTDNFLCYLQERTIAFLYYAFNKEKGRFRNFMDHSRQWLDIEGSEDSHGRAIWALGTCIGRSSDSDLQYLANDIFKEAMKGVIHFSSIRALSFVLLGIYEYRKKFVDDVIYKNYAVAFSSRLFEMFSSSMSNDWLWCEDIITYDNARISQALLLSGHWLDRVDYTDIALKSLKWLVQIQTVKAGYFRPIGSDGFFKKGEIRASYDQQPIEAHAMVSACIDAFKITSDYTWAQNAKYIFSWFLGNNDLLLPLYDESTGGCRDALHPDRVNRNQGAESTLSFLTALVEMNILEKITNSTYND